MNNRGWVHKISEEERSKRNKAMAELLEQRIRQMEEWTEQECQRLRMSSRVREAAERAWRKVARARRYIILPRHTPVEKRFLRMMIKLALAEDPSLVDRAGLLAAYLSRNYPFEWCLSPCTRPAVAEARAALIADGESEFGETPLAPQFAFVRYHWKQLHIKNVSDNGEIYAQAMFMVHHHYFLCRDEELRRSLGLHKHAFYRQRRLGLTQAGATERS